jgi:hypothetical protein
MNLKKRSPSHFIFSPVFREFPACDDDGSSVSIRRSELWLSVHSSDDAIRKSRPTDSTSSVNLYTFRKTKNFHPFRLAR